MSKLTKIVILGVLAVALLGGLHAWMNLGWGRGAAAARPAGAESFRVGFLPVT